MMLMMMCVEVVQYKVGDINSAAEVTLLSSADVIVATIYCIVVVFIAAPYSLESEYSCVLC